MKEMTRYAVAEYLNGDQGEFIFFGTSKECKKYVNNERKRFGPDSEYHFFRLINITGMDIIED